MLGFASSVGGTNTGGLQLVGQNGIGDTKYNM